MQRVFETAEVGLGNSGKNSFVLVSDGNDGEKILCVAKVLLLCRNEMSCRHLKRRKNRLHFSVQEMY